MKVVHVTALVTQGAGSNLAIGGLGRFLEEIVPAQQRVGLDVETVEISQTALESVAQAIASNDWNSLKRIGRDIVGNTRADIFHLHDWYGAVVLDHLFQQGHRAIVATSHLPLRRGFTYRDSGLNWNAKSLLESRCLHAVKRVSAPSIYVKRFLVEEYGLAENRIDVIPHGVNCVDFKFDGSLQSVIGQPRLLAVGRITDQKGFELLVRTMPIILASEPTAKLTIVGDGGARESLARLIVDLELENTVTIKTGKTKFELVAEYGNASLLIIPSQFEPFGLVGLEAMACGCPVLAITPTGASEYLEPFELTSSYRIAELGKAILKRIHQLRLSVEPRQDVRLRAEQMPWEKAAEAYANLYSKVVQ